MSVTISGVLAGLVIVLTMKYVPIFHGFDSNDIKRIVFEDNGKKYMLVPEQVVC